VAIAPALDTGDVDPALRWLRENVQHHGAALSAQEIIKTATGHSAPNPEPLLSYLEAKYSDIYQL
jgi:carboxypeptidase Taq